MGAVQAVANALVHREYSSQRNYVKVELFDDRIEISSPGGLLGSLTIEQLGVEKHPPVRNPLIAYVFYLCNYVEEASSGIPRIRRAMKEAGLPPPKFNVSPNKIVEVTLRRPKQVLQHQEILPQISSLLKAVDSKQGYQLFSFVLSALLIIMLFFTALRFFTNSSSTTSTSFIGVNSLQNGETIGISDGTFAFDTNRPDGSLKNLAASRLKQGNAVNAVSLFTQAHAMDTSDAEALIYQEDQLVLASGKPSVTLVVGTTLSGNVGDIGTGRSELQGAYIAQKENNDGSKLNGKVLVRLLIANAGGSLGGATVVAQQIVQAAKHEGIVGVMGWPHSSYSLNVINILFHAHIPIVSSTASSDQLTNISPFFFRVVPPNRNQAVVGAQYAENQLHVRRAALFVDPANFYSQNLALSFKQRFISDGNQIVATESYTVGRKDNLPALLQSALSAKPDLIYFSGYADDMNVLLTNFPSTSSNVQLMGGDALYELNGYQTSASANSARLHFTAFAYPDEWGYLNLQATEPSFFASYSNSFDPAGAHPRSYGYSRADSDAILSYDATLALLQGCKNALGNQTSLTSDALQQGLTKITGTQAIQGVSGQISFGSNGDPINKAIVVLSVDSTGRINLSGNGAAIRGCFIIGQC